MKREKIIEFLRDCPVYTRLYSPLYGYCEFLECTRNFIFVRVSKSDPKNKRCSYISYKFTEFGKPCGRIGEENEIDTSECMLFPSHRYKSWKNWQVHLFKDGDIIVENTADAENRNMFKYKHFDVCYSYYGTPFVVPPSELKKYRYATKEEQMLFRESQEKFEKDSKGEKKQLDLKETIKAQAETWGKFHPEYAQLYMGLLDDDDKLEDMYEKYRSDTFRTVCEAFCCDPKEVLRKMIEHRDEVFPKIAEVEKRSIEEASDNKFYYIENTVDEYDSDITAYCKTLKEAKERLKTCRDWYGKMGTGRIYEVEFGKGTIGKLVYKNE